MKREKGANFVRQSYAGVIRQRLLHIERQIAFGAKQDELRKELAKAGFEAAPGTFRKSLWRARLWWRIQLQVNSAYLQPTPTPVAPVAPVDSPLTRTMPTPDARQSSPAPQLPAPSKANPASPQRIKRDELDQLFQRKSVFTKT
jgi:hypothetical protein